MPKTTPCSTLLFPAPADMDINTSDTPKYTIGGIIYQVNSNINFIIHYYIIEDKITSPSFVLCQITGDLYKPKVKMRKHIPQLLKSTRMLPVYASTLFSAVRCDRNALNRVARTIASGHVGTWAPTIFNLDPRGTCRPKRRCGACSLRSPFLPRSKIS
jgi:hypothetical protein